MVHRTMQGKMIDMDKLMRQNELTPAVGNMKVNARGDEIGPNGTILRRREEIVHAYYEGHPESKPTPRVEVPKQNIQQTVTSSNKKHKDEDEG